jgi:hypothetical protein
MTIIKRCEKEVRGTWADKQQQAKTWLAHFVPHYTRRCLPEAADRCPASHSAGNDDSKKWLDSGHPSDVAKIAQLEQLMERMRSDVTLYIHGYNTCAVECAHGERTVHTSKRVEYWSSWEGKCRLVQLLHNHRTRQTGESLLQQLGWQVADGVSTHLSRIDRDKAKHHQLKTAAKYNARQKALRLEKKARAATDSELIARAEAQKQRAREKQRHYYSVKKQLLYEAKEMMKGGGAAVVERTEVVAPAADAVRTKRGRPRKAVQPVATGKENDGAENAKRVKVGADVAVSAERPVLKALMANRAVGVRLVLHPAMNE